MRAAMLGALIGAGLVVAAAGATSDGGPMFAQRPAPSPSVTPSGDLIALAATVDGKHQQLTLIDPKLRTISVYHVALATGDIELRCVRNIHWDLQMEYFNGSGLLPPEIRSMLESR